MKTIRLCGRGGCCPKLVIPSKEDMSFADDDIFVLYDDCEKTCSECGHTTTNGKVELTWVQLQELRNTINNL
jgi:hypothetical protein